MAEWAREIFIDIEPDVRIRYRRSEPPPPILYAVTLEVFDAGAGTTIRLWDNADAPDEHHEHEYTRSAGKQSPHTLNLATENEAMAAAILKARAEWEAMLTAWRVEP